MISWKIYVDWNLNISYNYHMLYGLVAQLGERRVRNAEVMGSIPTGSNIFKLLLRKPSLPVSPLC